MNKASAAAVVLGVALLGVAAPARAQFGMVGGGSGAENIEGLLVTGKGQVSARPNLVEIDLEVSAASELSADAIVKYRDARRKIKEAFSGLKLANVTVGERGLLLDQKGQMQNPYYFNYGQNNRAKTEVQLSRKMVVKASDIRKMEEDAVLPLVAKLLDVAQDAGAKVGTTNEYNPYYGYRYNMFNQPGLVRFVVDDFEKLQDDAYEKAIADAKSRAVRLARLSGVELGPIVAIREVSVPGVVETNPYGFESNGNNDEDQAKHKRLVTSKFEEIPVRVELMVRFEIRSARPKGADK
jgi:uncharacterized protein YggE